MILSLGYWLCGVSFHDHVGLLQVFWFAHTVQKHKNKCIGFKMVLVRSAGLTTALTMKLPSQVLRTFYTCNIESHQGELFRGWCDELSIPSALISVTGSPSTATAVSVREVLSFLDSKHRQMF